MSERRPSGPPVIPRVTISPAYHYDPERVLIELYTEMDVFIPELGMSEPRPWHEHLSDEAHHWKLTELNTWVADLL